MKWGEMFLPISWGENINEKGRKTVPVLGSLGNSLKQ